MTGPAPLFLSFWDLCLDNLPEGSFTHRRIEPDDAKRRIDQAREAGALTCLAATDLLAPYGGQRRGDHEALCAVLREHFGIDLSLRDFCSAHGEGDAAGYTVTALTFAQVRERSPLLIVTCAYALAEGADSGGFAFQVEPATVGFHLIEAR
jgi:hypothetical protein